MAERRAVPVYLSLEEAADCMSVSVKTIRRWIATGSLPAGTDAGSARSGSGSKT